jgi:hypothetical protein
MSRCEQLRLFPLPLCPDPASCLDCGRDTIELGEYYMVWDGVWLASGLERDEGMLCFACLERRIGRRLAPDDFTAAPINRHIELPRLIRAEETERAA